MSHIHILGTGAMACLWASYFSHTDSLYFIQRTQQGESFHFKKTPGEKIIEGQSLDKNTISSPIEHLIVATKAFSAKSALDDIRQYLSPNAQILLLQNGMGSQQNIQQDYTDYAVYACSSTEGAYKSDAHTLVHAGIGVNQVGPLSKTANENHLLNWLPPSHFQWQQEIEPILWKKLIINCAINPLTVLYQCQNGQLLQQEPIRQHMIKICSELDELIKHLKLNFGPSYLLASDICQLTANNYSSMYQDWHHQRPTEINFITGFFTSWCEEQHISCPQNQAILKRIQQLNLGP